MQNRFLSLTAAICLLFSSKAQVVLTEGFDGTTFVPTGWTDLLVSGSNTWSRVTAGTFPTQSPQSGAGEAKFNSYSASGGVRALITPPYSLQNNPAGGAPISFWMYRDNGYNTTADKIDVYYNTSASMTGAVLLGTVNRAIGLSPTVSSNGWYQYSFTIPNTVTSTNVYLILRATSAYGNNIFIDNVSWTSYPNLCSGTPATPAVAVNTPSGCPSVAAAITSTGATSALGISYQWQSSSSASGPWNNITTGTLTSLSISTPTTTFYRMVTTCSISTQTSTSSVVSYSVVNPGPCVCTTYGSSGASSTFDEEILGVAIGTMVNVSTCSSVGPGLGSIMNRYSNYAGFVNPMIACPGTSVVSTVTLGTCGGWYGVGMNVYADWNQDGNFTGTGELVANIGSSIQGANNFTIVVPNTALPGLTRIRIVAVEGTVPGPTGSYTWGETEDYCFQVLPAPVITAATGSVCPGAPFTLNPSGALSYTYAGPSSYTATGSSATVNPLTTSSYTITGTGLNGCVALGPNAGLVTVGMLPTPSLTAAITPTSFCVGGSATIQLSGANTYSWVSPASNSSSLTVSPTVTTIYTVASTGTAVCNGLDTYTVVVYQLPVLTTSPPTPTNCALTPINFNASGASTYTWSSGANSSSVSLSPTVPTTYTLSGTSTLGCVGNLVFTVNPIPTLSITPSFTTVCQGYPANFSVAGASSYTWANSVQGATAAISPTANTIFTVAGTNQYGCTGTAFVPVVTNTLPPISITPPAVTVCASTSVVALASGAASYTWNNGPTTASTQVSPSITTAYTVSGTDAGNGCVGKAVFLVNTTALPNISVVKTPTALCIGQSGTLTALGAQTFTWNGSLIQNDFFTTPSVTTVYTVSGTDSIGCQNTFTVSYKVNPKPTLTVSPAQTTICVGETLSVTVSGANTYSWIPGNSTASQVALSPKVTSNYLISGTDANNCSNTTTYTLFVSKCTSILENDQLSGLTIYPNPSNGIFTLSFEKDGTKSIEVMNSIGSLILTATTTENTTNIDLSSYSNGVYFIKVGSENTTKTIRLIKE